MKKVISAIIILLVFATIISHASIAATDEFKAFLAKELQGQYYDESRVSYAGRTFEKLGYINAAGAGKYTITNSKQVVKDYISGLGKNYGLYVVAHGNSSPCFTMDSSSNSQTISTSDISGIWHLVFIDSCSVMSTDTMASAFKTVGYSQRVSMGWYDVIYSGASYEWWGYFYPVAGTTNLRAAALSAADRCNNNTPIKAWGDKENWNGKAW